MFCMLNYNSQQLRHDAHGMIEASCPRRFEDETVVGLQLLEPDAGCRRGEKAPQSFDGRGNLVVGVPLREISANPFCLRSQARDGVVKRASPILPSRSTTDTTVASAVPKCLRK